MQCVAVCCSVLQEVSMHCSVMQCVSVCCNFFHRVASHTSRVCCRVCCRACCGMYCSVCCSMYCSACCSACCSTTMCYRPPLYKSFHCHPPPTPQGVPLIIRNTATSDVSTQKKNQSCPKNKWIMTHAWMRHATHMSHGSRTYHMCGWVMSHLRVSHE